MAALPHAESFRATSLSRRTPIGRRYAHALAAAGARLVDIGTTIAAPAPAWRA